MVRIVCLSLPIVVRISVFLLPIVILVVVLMPNDGLTGNELNTEVYETTIYEMVISIIFDVVFYLYLARKIKAIFIQDITKTECKNS